MCTLKEEISKRVEPEQEFTLLWTHPKIDEIEDAQHYTWLITIWLRINVSYSINESSNSFFSKNPYTIKKLDMFWNNHLKVVQYLDTFEDPTDEIIDENILLSLIPPLGDTLFSEDLTDWAPSNVEYIQIRETPLETLQKQFPYLEFNPLKIPLYEYAIKGNLHYDPLRHKALRDTQNYQKYIGCVLVLDSLFQLRKEHPSNDAIHYYYVGFVDLFYYCINCEWSDMSDTVLDQHMRENPGVSIWEANNPLIDTRAFHAGDLPDLFQTLTSIPLNGEQHKPDFMAAKILQKSLPFCGQRRKLIEVTSGFTESTAFWKLFAKVFWCILAGMYPGDLERPTMEKLLLVRQLTDETCARTTLNNKLKIGEYDGSALIVFTTFRRYIVYMAEFNAHYIEEAKRCIDWDTFESDTITRANLMRTCFLDNTDDPFGPMRKLMMEMHKNESELIVYRYKKYSLIKTIVQHCNNTLEKTIYKALQDWIQDRNTLENMRSMFEEGRSEKEIRKYSNEKSAIIWDIFSNKFIPLKECFERCAQKIAWFVSTLEKDIPVECKENLLNILIKVPKDDRLKMRAVRLMELPKYGGISSVASKTLIALTEVYKENPVPRKFNELIRKLNVYDFKVISWYLNIVNMLDKINVTVWDASTVKRLDFAMTHKRNVLFPGQTVPKGSYNVYLTLCCFRIATFKGSSYFGHKSISYDVNSGEFVCCKRHGKKVNLDGIDDDVDVEVIDEVIEMGNVDTRRYIRNRRKNFTHIPCKGQAVMRLSLRGFHMIYGNERDHLKRYCHCPSCGSFHQFKWLNFAGSKNAEYRCGECKAKELSTDVIYECCYCLARPAKPITHFEALKMSVYVMYPRDEHEPFKLKYFCKKHHRYAKIKSNQLSKEHLWAYIQKKERQKRLRIAMGIFR